MTGCYDTLKAAKIVVIRFFQQTKFCGPLHPPPPTVKPLRIDFSRVSIKPSQPDTDRTHYIFPNVCRFIAFTHLAVRFRRKHISIINIFLICKPLDVMYLNTYISAADFLTNERVLSIFFYCFYITEHLLLTLKIYYFLQVNK